MHNGHAYATQCAAFYIALIPFVLLFAMIFGARFFEGLRRKRKPMLSRPAIVGMGASARWRLS